MKRADLTPRAPRHRILSREEIELWRQVTQTVAPITGRASEPRIPEAPPAPPVAVPDAKHPQHIRGFKAPFLPGYTPPPQYAAPGYAPGLAPLSPIERRLKQRLSRGRAEVDAVMDLHGLRQDQAHGVLRRAAPQWLRAPEMRGVVIGFEEAAHHHGGAGAIYVRIRRLDRPRGRGAP